MGGAGHGGTTYKGYTIGNPARWHSATGKGLCAVMWFWILYRAKQDGPVVLGWRHPWEGHGDHSDGHGDELRILELLHVDFGHYRFINYWELGGISGRHFLGPEKTIFLWPWRTRQA
ncbi:NADH dehydrogenase [ubiquinone] 1 beta subcomplex subunit 2 [Carex littledalei]|uniref:NADH dehydrogenase [ubiquinone] 1 beta subcomplex subunit 2 n=1 Tax=Carex littledalei TaxID=544730 RepID=A0A833QDL7_9POAL|nr:NADH dehydrogenase [ubiquinone] 1 beta subcomplex subunit 2 [Carex littledalei]